MAALTFCFDTLRTGGHFVCKFYQGAEDKALEKKLKALFEKVHREKPESSRNVSLNAVTIGQDDTDMDRAGVQRNVFRRPTTKRSAGTR